MHPLTGIAMQAGALQKPDELDVFWGHVEYEKVRTVIEIGCDAGGMLAAWSTFTLASSVLGIDLPGGRWSSGNRLVPYGTTVILGDSHDQAVLDMTYAWVGHRGLDGVDLLFIDGDHTYEGVTRDYVMYADLVVAGGMIVLQDIVKHDPMRHPDVRVHEAWERLKKKHRHEEIISEDKEPWAGIGILFKE